MFEFNFKNKVDPIVLKVNKKKEIKNYDTNGTFNRKRFLLINYSGYSSIKINDKEFDLINFFLLKEKIYLIIIQ